jgi:hypothetical protein
VTSTTSKRKVTSFQRQDLVPSKDRSWHGVTKSRGSLKFRPPLVSSTTSLSTRGSSLCSLAKGKLVERQLSSRVTYATQPRCPTPSRVPYPTFHPPPTGPPASTLKNHSNGYSLRPKSYLSSSSISPFPVRKGRIGDYT